MKRKDHLPKWGINLIGSVVTLIILTFLCLYISKSPIEHPEYFIYSIDNYSEDKILLLGESNKENIYMVDGKKVQKWEYELDKPKYISIISEYKQQQYELSVRIRQEQLRQLEFEKNYKGSYQEYCDMQNDSWSKFKSALDSRDYKLAQDAQSELTFRKLSPHWARWVANGGFDQ